MAKGCSAIKSHGGVYIPLDNFFFFFFLDFPLCEISLEH